MTNLQAVKLRADDRVRRIDAAEGGAISIIKRIERVPLPTSADVRVYAGGAVVTAWEIDGCDARQGWPTPR